jgi:hypothetical protein
VNYYANGDTAAKKGCLLAYINVVICSDGINGCVSERLRRQKHALNYAGNEISVA